MQIYKKYFTQCVRILKILSILFSTSCKNMASPLCQTCQPRAFALVPVSLCPTATDFALLLFRSRVGAIRLRPRFVCYSIFILHIYFSYTI